MIVKSMMCFTAILINTTVCFRESFPRKIAYLLMIYLCNTVISTIIVIISTLCGVNMSDLQDILNPTAIFCRFIITAGELFLSLPLIHFLKKNVSENTKLLYYSAAIVFSFFTTQLYMVYIATYSNINHAAFIVINIITTTASLTFILLAFLSMKRVYAKRQDELMEKEQYKFLCEKYDTLKESYLEYRKLKHSFRDHLLIIDTLAKNNETDKLNEYIHKVHGEFCRLENVVFCRNTAVDIILANKYQLAADRHIKADFRIGGIENTGIDDIYICGILSNLLQNAVENTSAGKSITLTTYIKANNFVIVCENECELIQTNISKTSKPDKENHGYGITIIKDITDNLGGGSLFELRGTVFSAIITIPIAASVFEEE